jgi:hypothetical protein
VKFLPSKFPALWGAVADTFEAMLREGEVKLRATKEQF